MKITFIGAGNMSEAIIAGALKKAVVAADAVTVSDPLEERRNQMQRAYGVRSEEDNARAVANADVVVLAVKPQVFPQVWGSLQSELSPNSLVVSIMAGVTSETIAAGSDLRVVRVMPNTPSLVGRGASGIAQGALATESDMEITERLMQAVGVSVRVQEEQLHAVTALSGSGPAYLFYLMEAMIDSAKELGLDEATARLLCIETVGGAADLLAASEEAPVELRKRVTSKGGTTAAAIQTFDEQALKEVISAAMKSAFARSQELAQE
ncbi:MAG: pyrroline-5-carboxylate reductase [Kiritimatiellaceae bacterium]|jgi:pyrroline-5-carboxylate reductase|nr:pyrroline-5-carboxylate reductase [Kiritimatiellaceae bacterium]